MGIFASLTETQRIFRIGGPGKVIISYENVAIFEKINRELMVIGPPRSPQDGVYELDGFEQLRSVIDLQDRTINSTSQPHQGWYPDYH